MLLSILTEALFMISSGNDFILPANLLIKALNYFDELEIPIKTY